MQIFKIVFSCFLIPICIISCKSENINDRLERYLSSSDLEDIYNVGHSLKAYKINVTCLYTKNEDNIHFKIEYQNKSQKNYLFSYFYEKRGSFTNRILLYNYREYSILSSLLKKRDYSLIEKYKNIDSIQEPTGENYGFRLTKPKQKFYSQVSLKDKKNMPSTQYRYFYYGSFVKYENLEHFGYTKTGNEFLIPITGYSLGTGNHIVAYAIECNPTNTN